MRSGKPTATFIKEAVEEKLVRDALIEENSKYNLEYTLDKIKKRIIRDIPKALKGDCRKIIMYGSCARGDFDNDSDVDIAILTDSDREEVKKYDSKIDDIATSIEIDTMAIVNFVCLPQNEFEEKNTWYPYFMNIKDEGIVLYEQ
ncbi:MAG: nucleotidyltransferase domain-containing protein [Lachnospiraceae bacterium]|nr:nucleotidyltransferase domain-containing protein [Lachnospiraceae bacterium]